MDILFLGPFRASQQKIIEFLIKSGDSVTKNLIVESRSNKLTSLWIRLTGTAPLLDITSHTALPKKPSPPVIATFFPDKSIIDIDALSVEGGLFLLTHLSLSPCQPYT